MRAAALTSQWWSKSVPRVIVLAWACGSIGACATYSLVEPGVVSVANDTMTVRPSIVWNRERPSNSNIANEEHWTQNGALLDSITFIGAVPDGESIVKPASESDSAATSAFRSAMSPEEIASLVETYYRSRSGALAFSVTSVEPGSLAGEPALQVDFAYIGEGDVKRKGRALIAVVDNKFYLAALDAAALHYFDAVLPQFEAMLAGATLTRE